VLVVVQLTQMTSNARIEEQNIASGISYAYTSYLINPIYHTNVFPSCRKIGIEISWLISKSEI
jgi:hypothetical protein